MTVPSNPWPGKLIKRCPLLQTAKEFGIHLPCALLPDPPSVLRKNYILSRAAGKKPEVYFIQ